MSTSCNILTNLVINPLNFQCNTLILRNGKKVTINLSRRKLKRINTKIETLEQNLYRAKNIKIFTLDSLFAAFDMMNHD